MISPCPCKDCSARHVGCHASCPRYTKFNAECAAQREARAKNSPSVKYTIDATKRLQKAANRRRK